MGQLRRRPRPGGHDFPALRVPPGAGSPGRLPARGRAVCPRPGTRLRARVRSRPTAPALARIIRGQPAETRELDRAEMVFQGKDDSKDEYALFPREKKIRGTAGVAHESCGLA